MKEKFVMSFCCNNNSSQICYIDEVQVASLKDIEKLYEFSSSHKWVILEINFSGSHIENPYYTICLGKLG